MHYTISDLLAQKAFNKLDVNERKFVLSKMTAAEYTQQYTAIKNAQAIFKEETAMLIPNPSIATNALAQMKTKKQTRKKGVFFLLNHKVPTWTAAAAFLLLFFAFKSFTWQSSDVTNSPIVSTGKTHTVYLTKYITQTKEVYTPADTVIKVIYKPSPTPELQEETPTLVAHKAPLYTEDMISVENINYAALFSNHGSAKGVSIKNDSITALVNTAIY